MSIRRLFGMALVQATQTIALGGVGGMTASIDASAGNVVFISSTQTGAVTISAPTSPTTGQLLVVEINNQSGGAITTTWNAIFHLASAWTDPANTKRRNIAFLYNGSFWAEVSRIGADL